MRLLFFFFQFVQNEVDTIIGKKCSAPYTFAWGAKGYHNALVCGIETDINHVNSMDEVKVMVLFTNPIARTQGTFMLYPTIIINNNH